MICSGFTKFLKWATPNSILIMNVCFVSTTLSDLGCFSAKRSCKQIIQRDMLCVSVTFLDEMASLSETTVSMVSHAGFPQPGTADI